MSATPALLTIAYTGEQIAVDPEQITEDMFVPNVGNDPLYGDGSPGRVGATLFQAAESAKALVIPNDLAVECYGDDDEDGGGIILEIYPAEDRRVGLTCGWRDAGNLARRAGDDRDDNDPLVVKEALEFMAGEINSALRAR